jgi:hypothetical protein
MTKFSFKLFPDYLGAFFFFLFLLSCFKIGPCCVAQASLELTILLPPKCLD